MSFGNYSATPGNNTSINGINISEGCAAANVNNVCRQLMADGKELSDTVTAMDLSGYLPLTGGSLTGGLARSGAGGYLYFGNGSLTSGRVYVQISTDALPSAPAEGTIVLQYAA